MAPLPPSFPSLLPQKGRGQKLPLKAIVRSFFAFQIPPSLFQGNSSTGFIDTPVVMDQAFNSLKHSLALPLSPDVAPHGNPLAARFKAVGNVLEKLSFYRVVRASQN